MSREPNDWRLTGQQKYLQGSELKWTRYRPWSDTWEHDHCEFCTAKFVDPTFSDAHRALVEADPEVRTAGYATTDDHPRGAEYHWVCSECFDDFIDLFAWQVVQDE